MGKLAPRLSLTIKSSQSLQSTTVIYQNSLFSKPSLTALAVHAGGLCSNIASRLHFRGAAVTELLTRHMDIELNYLIDNDTHYV